MCESLIAVHAPCNAALAASPRVMLVFTGPVWVGADEGLTVTCASRFKTLQWFPYNFSHDCS